jgi:predicted O-methyltransferase YrrM
MNERALITQVEDAGTGSTGALYLKHVIRGRFRRLVGARESGVVDLVRIVPGFLDRSDIPVLYRLALSGPGSGPIAEIGSWKGKSTVALSLGLRDRGEVGACIYAIDPHLGSEEHRGIVERAGGSYPAFLRNVSRYGAMEVVEPVRANSLEAAKRFAADGLRFRLVFIDGAHDEDSVREDIGAYLPLLAPGGLMALHDYSPIHPGVMAAFSSELEERSEVIEHVSALLVVRPQPA